MILGSPAYMSPEQARGHNVDERCDLFSLGCVLYRLCAGKLPFTGKDAMSMLLSITTDEPPDLVKLHDELPPAFAELVHKLLAKKPEDRPASAKDVVQTIQAIERDWIASARTSQFRSKPDAVATTQGATVAADKEDPALEESAITDLELQETSSPRTAPRSSSRSWIFAGLGCSVLTAASMACCVIVMVAFNQGEVKVIPEDEVARAKLGEIHLVVHDHNKKPFPLDLDEPTPLPAGGYEFDLEKLPKDLQFEPSKFVLRTKMTLEIKVRYVPLKPAYELLTSDRAKEYQRKWAAYLKCPVVETNTLKAKLALIPPGEFLMGSTDKEIEKHVADLGSRKFEKKLLPAGYFTRVNHEKPAHRVQISKPIYMGVHEVTFGEFVDFVKKNGYTASQSGTGLEAGKELREPDTYSYLAFGPAYTPKNNHPVSNVAWRDVDAFCKWLSKTEKKTYRLPTEAEWEYACRAGSAALWSCGNDSRETHQREHMWFHVPFKFGDNPRTPEVVGQKAANQFGLHDMHGNVAEMCADLWAADYYQRSAKEKLTIDPKGPEPGVSGRVVRGGSFLDMAPLVRSAYRQYQDPGQARASLGFRIVCEVPMTAE
jgi:formylglycine-generating enzyme required for sulfatase activity